MPKHSVIHSTDPHIYPRFSELITGGKETCDADVFPYAYGRCIRAGLNFFGFQLLVNLYSHHNASRQQKQHKSSTTTTTHQQSDSNHVRGGGVSAV